MTPKHTFACAGFHAASFSRRHLLKVGGLGLLGLTLPRLLRAEALKKGLSARAKSIIFLYQFGGPSHIDMFDMKPAAPEGIRGLHKPISSKADGIMVSEHLPRLASVMNKVTLIRSMHHNMKNHNPASYYALSGHAPPVDDITLRDSPEIFPAYGSSWTTRSGQQRGPDLCGVAVCHWRRDDHAWSGSKFPRQNA